VLAGWDLFQVIADIRQYALAFDFPVFQSHAIAATRITQIMIKNPMKRIGIEATAKLDDTSFWVTVSAGGLSPKVSTDVVVDAPLATIT
jgi:hypothetical protein